MKKIAIAIGMALCVSAAAHAELGPTVTTATGHLDVVSGCNIEVSLDTPERQMTLDDVKDSALLSNFRITPSCEGRVWLHADGERDDVGRGVMKGADGTLATFTTRPDETTTQTGTEPDGRKDVESINVLKPGETAGGFIALASAGAGLPKTATKFDYTVAAGYMTE